MGKDYICGPKLTDPIPDCSLAEFFFPCVRSHPKGNIIQVDAITGRAETSEDFLKKSLVVSENYRRLGLGQNDVFCLVARNSGDVYLAVTGIFWLGAVVSPMDGEFKPAEFAFMFERTNPSVIICEGRCVDKMETVLRETGRKAIIIVLEDKQKVKKPNIPFEDLLIGEVDIATYKPLPVDSPSTKVAVIIPTSGSTGMPKGVGMTHRNIIFQCLAMKGDNLACCQRSFLVVSHFHWITCTLSFIMSLRTGMKRIYMTDINPENILRAIVNYKPEGIIMAPVMFFRTLSLPDAPECDFTCFKVIQLGGAVLNQAVLDLAKKVTKKDLNIWNTYGTSETTGVISRSPPGPKALSAGKLSYDVKVKIVDLETRKALGPNQEGEILATCPGLMACYVGNEEETKKSIIDGWCRTGDLGYYDETETLWIVDRLKELIKDEKGHQVAPSEIEGVIESLPGVREAGVVGMNSDTVNCFLVALVVKKNDSNITEDMIKDFARDKLADYKVPKKVKFVDSLPRLSTSKLKRKELKELAHAIFS